MEEVKYNIYDWKEISEEFYYSDILFGNGLSLNFSNNFNYNYIFKDFINDCSDDVKELFNMFNTTNFEDVLNKIEISEKILSILGYEKNRIIDLKKEIKEGLIKSIRKHHPRIQFINSEKINVISAKLADFKDIYTTNYDLITYYCILENKAETGDYFFENLNPRFNQFSQQDEFLESHIFYLHGSLFIFQDELCTKKIKKTSADNNLLDAIEEQIENDNYPLFISEGSSEKKLSAIINNPYLNFCLNNLKENDSENLVIYGHSLSEQDKHILEVIKKSYKKIAVGLRIEGLSRAKRLRKIHETLAKLSDKEADKEIEFFDSDTLFKFE